MKIWHRLLDLVFGYLRVPDYLPMAGFRVAVVFCHTYSVEKDRCRLTRMSESALKKAIDQLVIVGQLVSSLAKYGEGAERMFRRSLIPSAVLPVTFLRGAADTYDEMSQLAAILKKRKARSMTIVADQYHMRRSLVIAQRLFPSINIFHASSVCEKYEALCLPDDSSFSPKYVLQRISISYKLTHILWNLIFIIITPYLMRNVKPLVE